MKRIILGLGLVIGLNATSPTAYGSTLTLFCEKGETPESCASKTETAVERLSCAVDKPATRCTYSLVEDPKNPGLTIPSDSPYCELTSDNCSSPLPGNFGGENCFNREKMQISKVDRVHNGYWFGLWGTYSRTVCRSH